MTSPAVSIVLPTFNRLSYLPAALESVFAQTFTDWELVIADDGSERETIAYLATVENPPRVKVLRLPHSGNPGAVRNAACRAARGEYIAFLDSDDVWLPEKLTLQLASLQHHPERGWSHTAFALIDDSGKLVSGAGARWPATEGWVVERLIRMEIAVATSTLIVRRWLVEQVGGFDVRQRMCEDYDLWLRLAGLREIDGIHQTLLHKRRHQEHFGNDSMAFEDRLRALEKMLVATTDRSVQSALRRERAKVAAGLARSHAVYGGRWAALRTLAKSSQYSWGYPQWWLGGAEAAARAVTPASIRRLARSMLGRNRGG
jgi:glycosyltransferase involved in cell wall biosynthesis